MRKPLVLTLGRLVLAGVLIGPTGAQAQSAIAGVVRDTTGAVLPGVSVEASSPALIERVRSVVTDAQGQYRVIDLRPGEYVATFTLPGFSTVRREGIALETNFTANVNVEMRVGALEETVTVSGAAPTVDIRTTDRQQVLPRELLNALPAARNHLTNTIPAVNMSRVDVGGSGAMQQGSLSVYGSEDRMIMVDGMSVLSAIAGPAVYYNDGAQEEMVYQIGGGNAEAATGGVTINMIPKQGGNQFKGEGIFIFANTDFQGSNLTDALRARGLGTPAALDKTWDVNASVGGPIKRDKLWFFFSMRNWAYNQFASDVFYPDGRQGVDDNALEAYTTRLTSQISQKHKLTAMYDRMPKYRGHRNIESGGVDPRATVIQTTPVSMNAQVKWTATLSNKLLLEAGLSQNLYNYWLSYQPEVARPSAANPYGDIAKVDLIEGTRRNAALLENHQWYPHYNVPVSVSYVTGSHSFKTGVHWDRAWLADQRWINGDLIQRYRNGVPDSVLVSNTPTNSKTDLDFQIAFYVQDSWTIRRLTLNPGVRYDRLRGSVPEQTAGAGRFVPERHFAAIPNLPDWSDVSPRFGAAYDLFGDGTTAVKGSLGKYILPEVAATASKYNPMIQSTDTRTWNDLNRDDIAQVNELGPSTNNAFGIRRNVNPDPDLKRPFQWAYNLGVQRQLRPGVGLSATYNRRTFHRVLWTDNLATTFADYTLITIPDPRGNGQTLPVYNLNRARLGLIDELDTNTDNNKRTYNGIDLSLTSRFGSGGTVTVGSSTGRIRTVTCEVDDPNALRFCDQTQLDIPFRTTFKVVGSYPLPYGLRLSGVFQTVPGDDLPTTYSVGRAIVPTLTLASVSVRLDEPGSQFRQRINQLDFGIGKDIQIGRARLTPKLEVFNALNASPVLEDVTTFGSSLGRPNSVLPARLLKVNVQVRF